MRPEMRPEMRAGHQPVLGLGRLHHQPRDPRPGGGLEQGAHRLRLAGPGGAADEHVPVHRVERQQQRPGGPTAAVQYLTQRDRVPPGRGGLLGDVEVGGQRQPYPRDLALGRAGQRRDQLGAGVPGVARRRVPAGRHRAGVLHELGQAAGVAVGRGHRIGQFSQVGGRADQPGHPGRGVGVGAARGQPDPPQPGRQALPQFGVPQPEPVRLAGKRLGLPGHLLGHRADLGAPHGLGHQQPAERPGPHRQQALFQRRRGPLPGASLGLQPEPADGPPARQLGHEGGQGAAGQRLGPGAAGQGEPDLAVVLAADQAGAGREELDRAAGPVPNPAQRQRARVVLDVVVLDVVVLDVVVLGADAGVVGRDQRGQPLRAAGVVRQAGGCSGLTRAGPPRYLGNPVRVKRGQLGPA